MSRLLLVAVALLLTLTRLSATPTFISRSSWGAKPSRWAMTTFQTTPRFVIVHHTATPSCSTRSACDGRVRAIQKDHQKKWNDIAYNFLIAPSGDVYVGRGWSYQGGHAGSQHYNRNSIGVAFIGNFQRSDVTASAWQSYQQLLNYGKNNRKLVRTPTIKGHRDIKSTACPGNVLYRRL